MGPFPQRRAARQDALTLKHVGSEASFMRNPDPSSKLWLFPVVVGIPLAAYAYDQMYRDAHIDKREALDESHANYDKFYNKRGVPLFGEKHDAFLNADKKYRRDVTRESDDKYIRWADNQAAESCAPVDSFGTGKLLDYVAEKTIAANAQLEEKRLFLRLFPKHTDIMDPKIAYQLWDRYKQGCYDASASGNDFPCHDVPRLIQHMAHSFEEQLKVQPE